MKRFDFRLQRVLKLKQQRERLAELRQRQARQVLDAARAEVARLWEQLGHTAGALTGKLGGAVPASAWVAHYDHSVQLSKILETAEAREQRAEQGVQEAAALHTRIAQEVEALLCLRGQQWASHWQEVARADQVRLDELGLRRWRAARATEESDAAHAQDGERP